MCMRDSVGWTVVTLFLAASVIAYLYAQYGSQITKRCIGDVCVAAFSGQVLDRDVGCNRYFYASSLDLADRNPSKLRAYYVPDMGCKFDAVLYECIRRNGSVVILHGRCGAVTGYWKVTVGHPQEAGEHNSFVLEYLRSILRNHDVGEYAITYERAASDYLGSILLPRRYDCDSLIGSTPYKVFGSVKVYLLQNGKYAAYCTVSDTNTYVVVSVNPKYHG